MGKFMRKCKGLTEIAVMEVSSQSHQQQVSGVVTRARARMRTLAMAEAKRKRENEEVDLNSICHSRSLVRRKILTTNSGCSSSSNGSQNRSVVDLQDIHTFENSQYRDRERERKEITLSSESNNNMDYSTEKTEEEDSLHKSTTMKMPSEFELEEFFTEAESVLKKQFADKYNFDIEKEVPLEGRYEWRAMKI